MLSSKIMHPNGFYIMKQENYFYSLIYHALLQKKVFSEDYKERLAVMGREFGQNAISELEWLEVLRSYMRNSNYIISAPVDLSVPLRKDLICFLNDNEYDKAIIRWWWYKYFYILATGVVCKIMRKVARIFARN